MRCPTCGQMVDAAGGSNCPHCGQPLPVTPPTYGMTGPMPFAAQGGPPQERNTSSPPPPWQTPASQHGQPPYGMGGYAPPSQPLPPGYVPGYGYPSAPYPYYAPPIPPTPPKRRTGLIVGIVAAVVVLVLVCSGATFALFSLRQPTSLAGAQATASAQATTISGAQVIYSNTFASDAVGWSNNQYCKLGAGGYHVTGRACFAPIGSQTDVDISVQAKQISGPPTYAYGISLRNAGVDQRYDVDIDSNSKWVAYICTGKNPNNTAKSKDLVGFTDNPAIHGGLNITNTIEVKAQGSKFQLYVNDVLVGSFTDSTYTAGTLGLVSESSNAEVVFSQLTVRAIQ